LHRLRGSVLDILWRIEVRLAGAQIDHINAIGAHCIRRLHRGERR
jgi:hypothetical protein